MADGLAVTVGALVVGGASATVFQRYFPGVDLEAVIGAFGGSLCFVAFSKKISNLQRILYLIVGWIGGYFGAAEFLAQAWTKTSGISSFIAGLLVVVIAISAIEAFETGKWPEWMKTVGQFLVSRFLGKGKIE